MMPKYLTILFLMKIQNVTMLVSVPILQCGSQKFEPIKLDKSNSVNANNYFDAKFKELKTRIKN